MHNLDYANIGSYIINNKENVLEAYQLLKDTIYNSLSDTEKQYIESFMNRFKSTDIFGRRKLLYRFIYMCYI